MVVEATWDIDLAHAAAYFAKEPSATSCYVIGLDEVGRGALAGPVMVGAFAVRVDRGADATLTHSSLPLGIRDSKLLSAKRREALNTELGGERFHSGVGEAAAHEIDSLGISAALTLAAIRALDAVLPALDAAVAAIVLDGNVDYVSRGLGERGSFAVDVRVKADQNCMSVAAASIRAKVTRDALMEALDKDSPQFGWAKNKGYGSAAHRAAIIAGGPSPEHRLSWNLGVGGASEGAAGTVQPRLDFAG